MCFVTEEGYDKMYTKRARQRYSGEFQQINYFLNNKSFPSQSLPVRGHARSSSSIKMQTTRATNDTGRSGGEETRDDRRCTVFEDETRSEIRRGGSEARESNDTGGEARRANWSLLRASYSCFSRPAFSRGSNREQQTRLQAHFADRRDNRRSGCLVCDREKIAREEEAGIVEPARAAFNAERGSGMNVSVAN